MSRSDSASRFTVVASLVSFAVAAALLALSDVSVGSLITIQNTFFANALVGAQGMSTAGAMAFALAPFAAVAVSLAFLVLAFACMAAHNYYEENRRLTVLIACVGALITVAILGPTIATALYVLGIVAAAWLIAPLAHAYGMEFRKWIHFRVGSNAASKALMIVNVAVAIGVFFAVLAGQGAYETAFRADLKETIAAAVGPAAVDRAQVDALIDRQLDQPFFKAYIQWLPATSAFGVWVVLELLRVFLPLVAGAFSSAIIPRHPARR